MKPADDMQDLHDEDNEDLPDDLNLEGEEDDRKDEPMESGIDENNSENGEDVDESKLDPDPLKDDSDDYRNDLPELERPDETNAPEEADIENEDEKDAETANGLPEEELPEKDIEPDTLPAADISQNSKEVLDDPQKAMGVEGQAGNAPTESPELEATTQNQNTSGADANACNETDDAKEMSADMEKGSNDRPRDKPNNESNPYRNLGDATKKWQERLREISDASSQQNEENHKDAKNVELEDKEMEYIRHDQEDNSESQALGVATKEQIANSEKIVLDEENKDEKLPPIDDPMDIDEPANPSLDEESRPKEQKTELNKSKQPKPISQNSVKETQDYGNEEEIATPEEDEIIAKYEYIPESNTGNGDFSVPDELVGLETMSYEEMRHELEVSMNQWRDDGFDNAESQELWRSYVNLTRDLAFSLCEQLRLILEPTLASKLKGDYRTGKRLNMRRIISYIASQFRKDKIWMRRTKPSKRTYQIMISIDDSLSMAHSHCIHMAFESLAIISKALTQLEVGEICITSFGTKMKLVHPFEKVFSDECGADLISSFKFAQDGTDIKLLMDQSLAILEGARLTQQASSDCWQLQVVLSDGKCNDHAYIQARVRKAAEDHIAIVFIILDNTSNESQSIINLDSVAYTVDPLTMKPVLKMTRYMDTFPFDYFVVVRNMDKLPQILSETLRQFFSMVNR